MATARTRTPRLALNDLPLEMVDRILVFLPPRDLASLNATARLFHATPPGGCSPVERVLRERACARARRHERTPLASLPSEVRTWTEELLVRERVLELACAHSPPLAVGCGFSAFVDAEGGLHTCGEEAVPAQLMGGFRAHAASSHPGTPAVRWPTRVASLSAVRMCSVAAAHNHLLALSEAGAVYGCGKNEYGQLGLGDKKGRRSLVLVSLPASEPVVAISAGHSQSLALTAAGRAYSWGRNACGELGHGDTEDRWEPTRIDALDGVRVGGVAAGYAHTLLLTTRGAVYSFGRGAFGQLGHGNQQNQPTPRRIEALAGVCAAHVSAGAYHSLVVDAEGSLHSFGGSALACLGHGDGALQRVPKRVEALAGVRAVRASAGHSVSAVLGADGSVHAFGEGRNGQLGLGHERTFAELPVRVVALRQARVVGCALGQGYSLFVSADGSVYSCGRRSAALGLGMSAAERDEPTQRIHTPAYVYTAWRARTR